PSAHTRSPTGHARSRTRATATIHGQRRRRRPRGGRADDGASGRAPRGGWPPVRGGAGREAFVTGMTRVAGSAGVEPTGKAPSLAGRAAPPRGVKLGGVREPSTGRADPPVLALLLRRSTISRGS